MDSIPDSKELNDRSPGRRSFRLFKSKKSPRSSPFSSRKDKSPSKDKLSDKSRSSESDRLSIQSSDKLSIKSKDKSPKVKKSSLRKLFKRSKSTSEDISKSVSVSSGVSFNNIMCSTPIINTLASDSTELVTDSTCFYSAPTSEASHVTLNSDVISSNSSLSEQPSFLLPDQKAVLLDLDDVTGPVSRWGYYKTDTDRSDESGIFSPSFLMEPLSPPTGFKTETTKSRKKEAKLDRESSYEKLFNRFKIPTIELTRATNSTKSGSMAEKTSLKSNVSNLILNSILHDFYILIHKTEYIAEPINLLPSMLAIYIQPRLIVD